MSQYSRWRTLVATIDGQRLENRTTHSYKFLVVYRSAPTKRFSPWRWCYSIESARANLKAATLLYPNCVILEAIEQPEDSKMRKDGKRKLKAIAPDGTVMDRLTAKAYTKVVICRGSINRPERKGDKLWGEWSWSVRPDSALKSARHCRQFYREVLIIDVQEV